MSTFPDNGLYPGITAKEYFGVNDKRELHETVLSKSMLSDLVKNPWRWRQTKDEDHETKAMKWGSMVDCLALTPSRFDDYYVITPRTYEAPKSKKKGAPMVTKPWNANATACKKWAAKQGGKEIVSHDQFKKALKAVEMLENHPVFTEMMAGSSCQVGMVGKVPQGYSVKGLIDILPHKDGPWSNAIADLKTIGKMDSLDDVEWTIYKLGYHVQAALYLDLFNAVSGESRNEFWFIFQLSTSPYEVIAKPLDEDAIQLGRVTYLKWIEKWKSCMESDTWESPLSTASEFFRIPAGAWRKEEQA